MMDARKDKNSYKIIQGDNLASMREMPDNSVDAIVTDPPYGLSFMGKRWDYDVPSVETWRECLRVLKHGGHLLAFGGSRTYHRLVIPIEDAGFEIRDQIMWLYGSGFPKSHNVSKAIDKLADAGQEGAATATPDAVKWNGWGTALKPAHEPIVLARKPFAGTVAANVLEHGTGALNIDGCRVKHDEECKLMAPSQANINNPSELVRQAGRRVPTLELKPEGRWPANLIHDGSEEVLGGFPVTASGGGAGWNGRSGLGDTVFNKGWNPDGVDRQTATDAGGTAARYFYCAKASKRDRDEGLEAFREAAGHERAERKEGSAGVNAYAGTRSPARNTHPTVKPTQLMRYLCRLVTPTGGVVLDPFCGSGSTGKAAVLEGFQFVGCELDPAYVEIAEARCKWAASNPDIPKAPAEVPSTPSAQSEPAEPDRGQQNLFSK